MSDSASRSCSRSPAVASPWSGWNVQRAVHDLRQGGGHRQRGGDPDPGLEQRADDDRHAAVRGTIRDLGHGGGSADPCRLDHEHVDRIDREERPDGPDGRGRLVGGDRDADATSQLGELVELVGGQRLLDELDVEPGDRLEPVLRRREVPGPVDVEPQPDLRTDRLPDRADPLDEDLGLAFGAGLDLERHEPRLDRLLGRLRRGGRAERRERRVDADAVAVGREVGRDRTVRGRAARSRSPR